MINDSNTTHSLQQPITLPCGAILKNRLIKSPMSDSLGNGKGNPTEAQIRLYEKWAVGGAALSIIGEVQVDFHYPEKPGNLVLGPNADQASLKQLTDRAKVDGAHIWTQLGHAGALSHLPISKPKGPSPLDLEGLQCAGMSIEEIQLLPSLYANAALRAKNAGFTGVQIHAGHGFLLSQFLSPLFNRRDDVYGGSIQGRSRIVLEIIKEVRNSVGPSFPVGIRINSSDKLEGGLLQEDALELIRLLNETSIDLIDISGGTYFPGATASSEGSSKGPYYLDFAQRAREITNIPLMLTGGFKSREVAVEVIASDVVDMIGLGRAMILEPALPNDWLNEQDGKLHFPRFSQTVPGGVTAWYSMRLIAIGENKEEMFEMDLPRAIEAYEQKDAQRDDLWNSMFYSK